MSDDTKQAQMLLTRLAAGDAGAGDLLLPLVYRDLRAIAGRLMAGQRRNHTLQTTALVNEAWVRVSRGRQAENRDHFLRVAARAMRHVLVDHARKRNAKKRQGEHVRDMPDDALAYWNDNQTDLLALDEALTQLGQHDDKLLRLVELRYFGGLTLAETGSVIGLSEPQTRRAWAFSRGWLKRELEKGLGNA